ncbi:hypothetical protein HGM15179_019856 [Zosterops borbonicus]|uniref:Uncharacterized protein n=1 Tax=Zosterops borbonicus TaxID=364589 RepID=A0A8K1FXB9_9PASS|nr:hypothetical protein HGM15179_019856 [Zosterops borbonicus]
MKHRRLHQDYFHKAQMKRVRLTKASLELNSTMNAKNSKKSFYRRRIGIVPAVRIGAEARRRGQRQRPGAASRRRN